MSTGQAKTTRSTHKTMTVVFLFAFGLILTCAGFGVLGAVFMGSAAGIVVHVLAWG